MVEACRLLGATTLVHLAVPDGAGGMLHLHARLPPGAVLSRGQQVGVAMDPARAFVFRAVPVLTSRQPLDAPSASCYGGGPTRWRSSNGGRPLKS